tara:strand:- start:7134 stop:8339 length:1206 start_codon:yes stop_codon:yes gene_type:complete
VANTILTPTAVTREALRILHNNLVFVKTINRQYDSSFAVQGAKIGSSLKIRKPNQFTVRSGSTIDTQDVAEASETLTVGTQRGIDVNFTSAELTLDLDDFSDRILKPAMSRLASEIDVLAWAMYKDIYNQVGTAATTPATALAVLQCGSRMDDFAAPRDEQRYLTVNPIAQATLVDALKGLFQQSSSIAEQYRRGQMGTALGFDWSMSQNVPIHTAGAFGDNTALVNDTVASGDATIDTDDWSVSAPTVKQGDVFTIANVNSVNPETKQDTGNLAQFVVTADGTGSGNDLTGIAVSPSFTTSGTGQTITALPANNAAITFVGVSSSSNPINMGYHKDAFAIAFADLEMPSGVDFAAREVMDGISMRIVRQYDITNDKFPTRMDVYFGQKTIRPELACRLIG